MSLFAPASSLMPGQNSLSFRRQLQLLPGKSEGLVSAGADPGRGSGLGGVMYAGSDLVGAIGCASGVLGAGGGIEGRSEATPSGLGFLLGVEGVGWED